MSTCRSYFLSHFFENFNHFIESPQRIMESFEIFQKLDFETENFENRGLGLSIGDIFRISSSISISQNFYIFGQLFQKYNLSMKFSTFFEYSQKLHKDIFCWFPLELSSNFNHFPRIAKMERDHFGDIWKNWFWNRKFRNSLSGCINRLSFSN